MSPEVTNISQHGFWIFLQEREHDDRIRKVIFPDIFDEPPLRELVEQLRRNVEEDLGAAMQSFVVEQNQKRHHG
jgi:hypothetical protein